MAKFPVSTMYSQTEVMVAFLFVFTVLRTAVNADFVYSSMACFAICVRHIREGIFPVFVPAKTIVCAV